MPRVDASPFIDSVGTVMFVDETGFVGIETGFVAYREDIILATHHDGGPFTRPKLFITPDKRQFRVACYFCPDGYNSVCIIRTFIPTGLTPLPCADSVKACRGDRVTAIGYKDGECPVITEALLHRAASNDVYFYGRFTPGSCGTPIIDGSGKVICVYHGSHKKRSCYNVGANIASYNIAYEGLMHGWYKWDGEFSIDNLLAKLKN